MTEANSTPCMPSKAPIRCIVVMGVSGAGKTTVGRALAGELGWMFVDGDALHPAANVDRMARGLALTDDDRWPWLDRLGAVLQATPSDGGTVLACSALRRPYRDRLRQAVPDAVRFVFLDVASATAAARLASRLDHFMPVSLTPSQFATLEPPQPDELDVITVAAAATAAETVDRALSMLRTTTDRV